MTTRDNQNDAIMASESSKMSSTSERLPSVMQHSSSSLLMVKSAHKEKGTSSSSSSKKRDRDKDKAHKSKSSSVHKKLHKSGSGSMKSNSNKKRKHRSSDDRRTPSSSSTSKDKRGDKEHLDSKLSPPAAGIAGLPLTQQQPHHPHHLPILNAHHQHHPPNSSTSLPGQEATQGYILIPVQYMKSGNNVVGGAGDMTQQQQFIQRQQMLQMVPPGATIAGQPFAVYPNNPGGMMGPQILPQASSSSMMHPQMLHPSGMTIGMGPQQHHHPQTMFQLQGQPQLMTTHAANAAAVYGPGGAAMQMQMPPPQARMLPQQQRIIQSSQGAVMMPSPQQGMWQQQQQQQQMQMQMLQQSGQMMHPSSSSSMMMMMMPPQAPQTIANGQHFSLPQSGMVGGMPHQGQPNHPLMGGGVGGPQGMPSPTMRPQLLPPMSAQSMAGIAATKNKSPKSSSGGSLPPHSAVWSRNFLMPSAKGAVGATLASQEQPDEGGEEEEDDEEEQEMDDEEDDQATGENENDDEDGDGEAETSPTDEEEGDTEEENLDDGDVEDAGEEEDEHDKKPPKQTKPKVKKEEKIRAMNMDHDNSQNPQNGVDDEGNIVVTDTDILLGRGHITNNHKGNRRFRDIVALYRPDYVRALKVQKPAVARVVVRAIRNGNPPGRFLRKDDKTGKWVDVGDKKAAEKTSQALRERVF